MDLYGPRYGLTDVVSGHNNYWLWGHTDARTGTATIAINLSRTYLQTIFGTVISAGTVRTPWGVWTEERGDPIWICTHQKMSWAQAWPSARHYG